MYSQKIPCRRSATTSDPDYATVLSDALEARLEDTRDALKQTMAAEAA